MWLASYADVLRLVTRSYERLLNRRATSVHWRLAFVSKEPIRCSVNADIFVVCQVVCHVLMHCLGSFILHDICFRGAESGKEGFFREMLLTCI